MKEQRQPVTYEQAIQSITAYKPADGQRDYFDVGLALPQPALTGLIERLKKIGGQL